MPVLDGKRSWLITTPPSRALVVYESLFGNTQQVAHAVARGMALAGWEVQLVDVVHARRGHDLNCDLLVLGAPTHAFSLSRPSTRADPVRRGAREEGRSVGVREWLDDLPRAPEGAPRLAAAFDTRVTGVRRVPLNAARHAFRELSRRGYTPVDHPTGFLVKDVNGPLDDGEERRAAAWGGTVARMARRERWAVPDGART